MAPRAPACIAAVLLALLPAAANTEGADQPAGLSVRLLDVHDFHSVEGPSSGPQVYYEVIEDPGGAFIRGSYRVGLETLTLGVEVPEEVREKAKQLRWRWRERALPVGGDECRPGYGDSAASVFVTFKRGLKWYILKYVWSSVGRRGAVCDRKRTLTLARDTVVLESGPGSGEWVTEEINIPRAFLSHFGQGRGEVTVPDLVGVGIMTDGDQTVSPSGADWSGFEIVY